MRKKLLSIVFVGLIMSAFYTATVCANEKSQKGALEQYQNLYMLKSSDLENDRIADIIKILEELGWWLEEQNWFCGYDDGEILDISFQKKIETRNPDEIKMLKIGAVFLALIDNLQEINFSYIADNGIAQINYSMCIDCETVNETLKGIQIQESVGTEKNFENLMTQLDKLGA